MLSRDMTNISYISAIWFLDVVWLSGRSNINVKYGKRAMQKLQFYLAGQIFITWRCTLSVHKESSEDTANISLYEVHPVKQLWNSTHYSWTSAFYMILYLCGFLKKLIQSYILCTEGRWCFKRRNETSAIWKAKSMAIRALMGLELHLGNLKSFGRTNRLFNFNVLIFG